MIRRVRDASPCSINLTRFNVLIFWLLWWFRRLLLILFNALVCFTARLNGAPDMIFFDILFDWQDSILLIERPFGFYSSFDEKIRSLGISLHARMFLFRLFLCLGKIFCLVGLSYYVLLILLWRFLIKVVAGDLKITGLVHFDHTFAGYAPVVLLAL